MNVVPTPRVRQVAADMIRDAEDMPGADVILKHAGKIRRSEIPALIGVLLTATKQHKKLGRTPLPITYTEAEQRECNRRYKAGERDDDWVTEGYRQYQRTCKRRRGLRVVA